MFSNIYESENVPDLADIREPFVPHKHAMLADASFAQLARSSQADTTQQDSAEYLNFLLDGLHTELIRAQDPERSGTIEKIQWEEGWQEAGSGSVRRISMADTHISKLFRWQLRQSLGKRKQSHVIEPCYMLDIDISHDGDGDASLIASLNNMTMSKHDDVHRRVTVDSLPPVLLIHVKRFVINVTDGTFSIVKDCSRFDYPEEFDFPSTVLSGDALAASRMEHSRTSYRLLGVISHVGDRASSGHYVCIVKQGDNWWQLDDERTLSVTEYSAMHQLAYVLVYVSRDI